MQWFTDVIKKYAVFSGRARRKELWMYALFYFIVAICLAIVDRLLGLEVANGSGILSSIYWLALLVPSLAVQARRLHDTGRSPLWLLLWLTCIGVIVLSVFWAQEGNPGDNQYGPDPKAAERGQGFGGPAGPAEPGYPTV